MEKVTAATATTSKTEETTKAKNVCTLYTILLTGTNSEERRLQC